MNWQLKNNSTVKCLFGLAHHVPDSKMEKAVIKNYLKGSHMYFLAFEKCSMLSRMCCVSPRKCWFFIVAEAVYLEVVYKIRVSQNPQENTCVGLSFLCEFCKMFESFFFVEHLRATASVCKILVSPQTALLKRWYQKNSDTSGKFLLKVMTKHSR